MSDNTAPVRRIFQVLSELTQRDLDALLEDRDELQADYDLLSRTLYDIEDWRLSLRRIKIIKAARKILSQKDQHILDLQHQLADYAHAESEAVRQMVRRLWE